MDTLIRLKERYDSYREYAKSLSKKYSPVAGLLGFGKGPKDDPGHDEFFKDVEITVGEIKERLESESAEDNKEKLLLEAFKACEFLLMTPKDIPEQDPSYWYIFACQGYARELIPYLTKDQSSTLLNRYCEIYPKRMRMPVQNEIVKMLKAQS